MMHNAIKAGLSTGGGALSDRLGRRRVILVGWLIYGCCYFGFGWAHEAWQAWALLALYGIYYSLVEGSEKALLVDLVGPELRGRAFGYYYVVVGLAAMPASFGFGVLVERWGPRLTFTLAAALAAIATVLLAVAVPDPRARAGARS
jgi:MFS family permease